MAGIATSAQIQGNVLQPFDGQHQAFLFLSFRNRRAEARTWLGSAATRVDDTADVAAARTGSRMPAGRSLMNVGLTASGLTTLHPEVADDLVGFTAFWEGPLGTRLDDDGRITSTPALLGDIGASDPMCWLIGGPRRAPVDALLTLAADDADTLRRRIGQEQREAARAGLEVMPLAGADGTGPLVQHGDLLHNADGKRIEHFGFVDGISQPGVRGLDGAAAGSPVVAAGEFVLGLPGERRPLNRAPRPSPAPWMRGGSFQVFRRLRQDVAGWWDKMHRLSDQDTSPEDVAARAIGRRLDGTPLCPGARPGDHNDFTFQGDENGTHTPHFAHIRKMNPRRDEMFRDRSHKLLRRGIPFGPPMDRATPDDNDRGMLFNAYMASIEDQFEFLQRCWANDPGFPSTTIAKFATTPTTDPPPWDGLDPVLGPGAPEANRRLGTAAKIIPPLAFGGFVTTTGAVYAFAPARSALHQLAADTPLTQ
jgi:Dyp-type peroxidase family